MRKRLLLSALTFALTVGMTAAASAQSGTISTGRGPATASSQDDRGAAPVIGGTADTYGARYSWRNRSITPRQGEFQLLLGPNSSQALGVLAPGVGGNSEFGVNVVRTAIDVGSETFSDTGAFMPIGLAFSPVRDLEIGIAPTPSFEPGGFGSLPLWVTYQLLSGDTQIGVRATFYLPTASDSIAGGNDVFGLQLGVPMLFRFGSMRLDTGLYFTARRFSDPTIMFLDIPVRLGFQITDKFFAGFQTGADLWIVQDQDVQLRVPLYAFAGYTIPTALAPIDLGFRFGFDQFIKANDGTGDAIDLNDFSFAFGVNLGISF